MHAIYSHPASLNQPRNQPSRRQFLRGGALLTAGSTAAFLAACGGGNAKTAVTATRPAAAAAAGGATATTTAAAPATGAAAAATAARPATVAAAASAAAKPGGRLKLYYNNSTSSLNPITDSGQRLTLSAFQLWDRLVSTRLNKDTAKEYVLEAALSVEQPDPLTVVFKLKPGMVFQQRAPVNGRAVAADDIVASQTYVRDEPKAGNNAFQLGSMQSVTATDAQTVTFKLKGPNPYLFSGTQLADPGAQCIFPKELIGNLDTTWSVGSGPYEMADFVLNKSYLYKKFAGYHEASKGLPYIDEREFTVIVDPAAQEAAFRSEQIHVWTVPNSSIADPLKKDLVAKVTLDEYPSLSMIAINANVTKAPWNDARVREAIYRVANRQQYLDLLDQGRGKIPTGPMPFGLADYQLDPGQTAKYFVQDARAAKQLLDAAAFPYDKDVEISTLTDPRNNQGCEILQQQMSQIGIKSHVLPMPIAEWLSSRIATGNWEMFVAGWPGYDTPQVPLRLQHTQTNHVHRYAGLKDPAVDKLIEQSEVTVDKNERIKLVKDIQIAVLDKYTPMIYAYNYNTFLALYNYVKSYELTPATIPMYRVEMWLDK